MMEKLEGVKNFARMHVDMWNNCESKFWYKQLDGTYSERMQGWDEALAAVSSCDGMQVASSLDIITDFANHQWMSVRVLLYEMDDFKYHWQIIEQGPSNFRNRHAVAKKLVFAIAGLEMEDTPDWKLDEAIGRLCEIAVDYAVGNPDLPTSDRPCFLQLNDHLICDECILSPHDPSDEYCDCCHCSEDQVD